MGRALSVSCRSTTRGRSGCRAEIPDRATCRGSALAFHWAYLGPGESRRPTLTWPRQIPLDGEPADVVAIVDDYSRWLSASNVPKLFINADQGVILTGAQREHCRAWPNQTGVTVPGYHFIQEDAPAEIGQAVAEWMGSLG